MKHILANLLLLLCCEAVSAAPTTLPGTRPAGEIAALISRLSSDHWQARQDAQAQLSALGAESLDALMGALRGLGDEEPRIRLEAAIRRIEARVARQPTKITIHLRNAPLKDALDLIARQADVSFELHAPSVADRKVTLNADQQPFHSVMREIARQTDVGPLPATHNEEAIVMAQASVFGRYPGVQSGLFYVTAHPRRQVNADGTRTVRFSHLCSRRECIGNGFQNILNSRRKPRVG